MRRLATTLAFALAATTLASALAEAAPKRRNELTVTRRSYFDAGNVVRPGSGGYNNYVTIGQGPYAQPVYQHVNSLFGGETLPQRFSLPYR